MSKAEQSEIPSMQKLGVENIDELERQIQELEKETWLSTREAQISVLMNYTDNFNSLLELAEKLGISKNTIYQHAYNINQKIGKSKRTIQNAEKT